MVRERGKEESEELGERESEGQEMERDCEFLNKILILLISRLFTWGFSGWSHNKILNVMGEQRNLSDVWVSIYLMSNTHPHPHTYKHKVTHRHTRRHTEIHRYTQTHRDI